MTMESITRLEKLGDETPTVNVGGSLSHSNHLNRSVSTEIVHLFLLRISPNQPEMSGRAALI